jgi:alpha-beta hydrolase superfamily lysophospholipase
MMTLDTWFGSEAEPTLGFLDLPESGRARGAVVICPPLGHEHVIAYRGLRLLGQELADRGIAAFRFDYLGEGDGSGESAVAEAPERWLRTIEQAVAYLRDAGIQNIALAGVTSGALLAASALTRVTDLSGLVLWDPVLAGSKFLRRQKSIHRMTVGTDDDAVTAVVPLLSLTLHPEAANWLEGARVDADAIETADIPSLLIARRADEDKPELQRLISALPSLDARFVDGQEAFLDVASSITEIPAATIDEIVTWVDARLPLDAAPVHPVVRLEAHVATSPSGVPIVERLGRFGAHRILTIETVLDDGRGCDGRGVVLMQPAAAEHRTGPGRFQVRLARELAAQGYRAVRYDRRISGETTPVVATEPNMVLAREWVDDADELARFYSTSAPLGLVGICSGAWLAGKVAPSVNAALTVMLDINYYRTPPLRPGQYAERARNDQHGEPKLGPVRHAIREIIPHWLWRAVSFTQVFNDPTIMLTPVSRIPGGTLALLLAPEDVEVLRKNRGADAVARLRAKGADVRVVEYEAGDHAMFGETLRAVAQADILALVAGALPAAPVPVTPSAPRSR